MKNFILFTLLVSTTVNADVVRKFHIGDQNPPAKTIEGIDFPRSKDIKYRGVSESQYDTRKAVRAMLGADEDIESILFSGIKLLLMKKPCGFCSNISEALVNRGFGQLIEKALEQNKSQPFSEAKAKEIAFKMIEEELITRLKQGKFEEEKLDYRAPEYEMFPQDIIFSTVHLEVANVYSKQISILKEGIKNYVDLNYWNKIHNGSFLFIQRTWADRGEFITPILVEASDVIGHLEYLSKSPNYTVFRPLQADLDYAFMQVKNGEEKAVLVFDGKIKGSHRATAIVKDQGEFVLAKSQYDHTVELPQMLKPLKDTPSLIGVFKLCPKKASCKISASYFKDYKRSRRWINKELVESIVSQEIDGQVPKLFLVETTLKADETVSPPFTPAPLTAKEIIDTELKSAKAKTAEKIAGPKTVEKNKITWEFNGKKLPAGNALYMEIPDSHRSSKLKKVTLYQRQDDKDNSTPLVGKFDKSPAYTGVEFYVSADDLDENWRYLSNPGKYDPPKDSFFADLISEARVKGVSVVAQDVSKGHDSGKEVSTPLLIAAVRLLGLGTDPATLYKLELDFE